MENLIYGMSLFWRTLTFYSLFIFVLVNIASVSMHFKQTSYISTTSFLLFSSLCCKECHVMKRWRECKYCPNVLGVNIFHYYTFGHYSICRLCLIITPRTRWYINEIFHFLSTVKYVLISACQIEDDLINEFLYCSNFRLFIVI